MQQHRKARPIYHSRFRYNPIQMRKKFLLMVPLLLFLAGISWLAVLRAQRLHLHDSLVRAVRMYNIGYASQIKVQTLTDFEWELLHIFGPYSTRESVERALGFEWIGARFLSSALRNDETACLLVFVLKGEVVHGVEIERYLADFAGLASGSPYPPQAAHFFILPGSQTELGLLEPP